MYIMFKDDPWGNKVPIMAISGKHAADEFLEKNRHIITDVVDVPRNVQTLIKM